MKNINLQTIILLIITLGIGFLIGNQDIYKGKPTENEHSFEYKIIDKSTGVYTAIADEQSVSAAFMIELGEKIHQEYKNISTDNLTIHVYNDEKAYKLQPKWNEGTTTEEEDSFYNEHYLGYYSIGGIDEHGHKKAEFHIITEENYELVQNFYMPYVGFE